MPGLSFLSPLFLVGALAAIVPIALHLLARQAARPVPFGLVRFLRATPVEQARRRRLSDLLLLALRVAALLLLALAFARPFVRSATTAGTADPVVLALDTSFSMGASGVWADAQRQATEALDRVAAASPVTVVAFDDRARVVQAATLDRRVVRAAVETLTPGAGGTDLATGLRAAELVLAGGVGQVIVVSDFQWHGAKAGAPPAIDERVTLTPIQIARRDGNLAVEALDREAGRITSVVRNHGGQARTTTVELLVDRRRVAGQAVEIGPGQAVAVTFEAALPDAGVLEARVTDGVGPPADDTRYAVIDAASPLRVLVVEGVDRGGGSSFYVQRALEAAGAEAPVEVVVARADAGHLRDLAELQKHQAVVLVGTRGLDRDARRAMVSFVERGGGVVIAAGPSTEAAVVSDIVGRRVATGAAGPLTELTTFASVDRRHAALAPLGAFVETLTQVSVTRHVALEPADNVLATFGDGRPALVEASRGEGRALVLATDLSGEWNGAPLHPVFAPWVEALVRYAAGGGDARQSLVVGEAAGADTPGVVTMGEPPRRVAVNVDLRESSGETVSGEEFVARVARDAVRVLRDAPTSAARQEAASPLWRYAVLAMLAALVVEHLVAGRRPRAAAAEERA